jgi:hypothetical protein
MGKIVKFKETVQVHISSEEVLREIVDVKPGPWRIGSLIGQAAYKKLLEKTDYKYADFELWRIRDGYVVEFQLRTPP